MQTFGKRERDSHVHIDICTYKYIHISYRCTHECIENSLDIVLREQKRRMVATVVGSSVMGIAGCDGHFQKCLGVCHETFWCFSGSRKFSQTVSCDMVDVGSLAPPYVPNTFGIKVQWGSWWCKIFSTQRSYIPSPHSALNTGN